MTPAKKKEKKVVKTNDRWCVPDVDPQALFILETARFRMVVGRSLARMVIALISGGSLLGTVGYWLPPLGKWLRILPP